MERASHKKLNKRMPHASCDVDKIQVGRGTLETHRVVVEELLRSDFRVSRSILGGRQVVQSRIPLVGKLDSSRLSFGSGRAHY